MFFWFLALVLGGPAFAGGGGGGGCGGGSTLTCSSVESGQLSGSGSDTIYYCGKPYAPLLQGGPSDSYSFTCQQSGSVTINIDGMDCDLDVYVLDSTCDPNGGCLKGSTKRDRNSDAINFNCDAGVTYNIVVEGYGFATDPAYSGHCDSSEGNYTLSFDAGGTACPEDCGDGADNDFDGDTDCADTDCAGDPLCGSNCDADGDGFDADNGVCRGTDCDDSDANINPAELDICNGINDDCDNQTDEDGGLIWFRDQDGDNYGDDNLTLDQCDQPNGYTDVPGDCNDADNSINPGASEVCNGIDDDCNGTVDDGLSETWHYADTDGDGYGDSGNRQRLCGPIPGWVDDNTDCDDTDAAVNPGAAEVCNGIDDDCNGQIDETSTNTWYPDDDNDGFGDNSGQVTQCNQPPGYVIDNTDCNDADANINPGEAEICNGIDDNCSGQVDEGLSNDWYYFDGDGDAFGDSGNRQQLCGPEPGWVSTNGDCDDGDSAVNPAATEVCNTIDDNCDGTVDEGVTTRWWTDSDGDGYGDAGAPLDACSQPANSASDDTDCDDGDSAVNPGATEVCNNIDDDCDGLTDEDGANVFYADQDGDGFGDPGLTAVDCTAPNGFVADDTDCDDLASTTFPGATELCDNKDNDCDGTIDNGVTLATWYADTDNDGFGDPGNTLDDCQQPAGYIDNDADCDDTDAQVRPTADERCNGYDDDCDGFTDEDDAIDAGSWYLDDDGDSYGAGPAVSACAAPADHVASNTDCDDGDAAINPGATEVCNGIDDDCNGTADDGLPDAWYHADTDADGYGDNGNRQRLCGPMPGWIADNSDCDDQDAAIFPGATEVCDTVDNDCDGLVDEGVTTTYWTDADNDGYGNAAAPVEACSLPAGASDNDTDCDDTSRFINPGGVEFCNLIDDDCDGIVDDGVQEWLHPDADGDGFGDKFSGVWACPGTPGLTAEENDCDDSEATTHPMAPELCDNVDNNCNGQIDDNVVFTDWYADVDQDGYGDPGAMVSDCQQPSGHVTDNTDCDDGNDAVHPAAEERCNGYDDDCDGLTDEPDAADAGVFWADVDQDSYGDVNSPTTACTAPQGYVSDDTDCDDTDATVHPGATEVPWDGIDNDCVGGDICDADGDGYLYSGANCGGDDCHDLDATVHAGATETPDGTDQDCDGIVDNDTIWFDDDGDGFTEAGGDCDDDDDTIHPSAVEICDPGIDQDCDGTADEGTSCYDDDGDGVTEDQGDCNDNDALISPNATEIDDNGVDDDCDGFADVNETDADGDGYSAGTGGDCDDSDPDTHPDADELPDAIDNDCDGTIDEGTIAYDDDGDGYCEGVDLGSGVECTDGTVPGDCHDGDASVHPGATEVENDIDDDCDGDVDEGTDWFDDDGDGLSERGGDCDDTDPDVGPEAVEVVNGIDDNCDGEVDEAADADRDGYTAETGDCNDNHGWVNPGMAEQCDSLDNNCDGQVDEGCDDEAIPIKELAGGCSCQVAQPAWGSLLVLLVPALLRRHRRRA